MPLWWGKQNQTRLTCHINKTIHTLKTATIVIKLSGRWVQGDTKDVEGEIKNTTSSEYFITRGFGTIRLPRTARCGILSGRRQRKARVVSPVISRSGPWNSTQECYVGWHPPAFAVVSFRTCRVLSLFSNLTCKRGSVGQSEALLISRSWVRFRFKPENSNSHGFELHRLSIKSTKILLKVIKAIFIIKVRVNVVY